jgi:hypothetical protein
VAAIKGDDMTDSTLRRLAAVLALVALAMEAVSLVLLIPNSRVVSLEQLGFNGVGGTVAGATYPLVGWLIASRRPRNPIGWIFLAIGLSQAGSSLASQYAVFGLIAHPGSLPLADLATWVGAWAWAPGFVLLFVVVLVFPDGTLPSRRWRIVPWTAAASILMTVVAQAIGTWGYRGLMLVGSPPSDTSADPLLTACLAVANGGSMLVIPVGLASVTGIVIRFRRSGTVERHQIKWFAAGAAVEIGVLILMNLVTPPYPFDVITSALIVPLVPIATALAVFRYRLYEIDRIVSRTIGWALSTGLVAAVFVAAVVLLETLLAGVTQGQTLAVAASTLAAAALFQPVRRRVQRMVDRRFDRARYDGQATADSFARRLRADTGVSVAAADLSRTAAVAVAPASLALWLRPWRSRP